MTVIYSGSIHAVIFIGIYLFIVAVIFNKYRSKIEGKK